METSKSNFFAIEKIVKVDERYQKTNKHIDELLSTLPLNKGWWLDHLFRYQGFWLPKHGIGGSMLINDHFKPRSTDIIIATSPKCGTTWLRALVFSIVNRHSFDFTDHPLRKANPRDLVPFFEASFRGESGDGSASFIEGLPSPRLLATHLPYSLFSKHMTDDTSDCRFVYICRDPKDVFVSKWHFSNKLTRPKELPLEEAFESFCKGVSHYGPFWDHVLGYWRASLESPKKVLFLKYEVVKKETSDCVRKVAEFLGAPFSQEEENKEIVEEIVKLCSFENMSNLDVNKSGTGHFIRNSDFFRKGEVGDWVNHLSPQMVEMIDQITEERLQGTGFSFH